MKPNAASRVLAHLRANAVGGIIEITNRDLRSAARISNRYTLTYALGRLKDAKCVRLLAARRGRHPARWAVLAGDAPGCAAWRPWPRPLERRLLAARAAGHAPGAIGETLGKSEGAVRCKLQRIEALERRKGANR